MIEIKVNFPLRNTELTVNATDGKTDVSNDFLLAYAVLELPAQQRTVFRNCIDALHDAERRHSDFPADTAEMLAVIAEELGEAFQAHNDSYRDNLKAELQHTVATCIRALERL